MEMEKQNFSQIIWTLPLSLLRHRVFFKGGEYVTLCWKKNDKKINMGVFFPIRL